MRTHCSQVSRVRGGAVSASGMEGPAASGGGTVCGALAETVAEAVGGTVAAALFTGAGFCAEASNPPPSSVARDDEAALGAGHHRPAQATAGSGDDSACLKRVLGRSR